MRRRAVIFDDQESIRTVLWLFFDRRGYEVFSFSEPGLCPLHVVRECPCPAGSCCSDLIISDVNMMGANGLDFIEELIERGCRLPNFALMSGDFSDADLDRAAELDCVLFTKPLNMEALTVWVEEVEGSIPSERILYDWSQKN
jgi:CheY-like chemotaxis protein